MRRLQIVGAIVALISLTGCATGDGEAALRDIAFGFEGAEGVAASDLEGVAQRELDAFRGAKTTVADLSDAGYAMETLLLERGYAHAWVEFEVLPNEEAPERVVFKVHEGAVARIAALSFEVDGDPTFDEERLRSLFIPKGGLLVEEEDLTFRQRDLEGGVGRVETLYLLDGWLDVEVTLLPVEWNAARTEAEVTVRVTQGKRYLVRTVRVEDALPPAVGDPREALAAFEGQPFHARVPAQAAAVVRGSLTGEGYLESHARGEAKISAETGDVDIVISVQVGPRLRLGSVSIEGLERTSPGIAEDLLDLEIGEILTRMRIQEARNRLFRSGLFATASLTPRHQDVEVPETDELSAELAVVLEELEARSVDFEVGFGSYELARGKVRYRDRNLFGIGRDLTVELHASVKSYGASARLADPYLIGFDDLLEVGVATEFRQEPAFDRTRFTFDLSWRHRFDAVSELRSGYLFSSEKAANSDGTPVPGVEEEGFVVDAGLFTRYRRDGRDQWLAPTDGYLLEAGVFWSTPVLGADLEFLELQAALAVFHQVFDGTVLAAGARVITRHVLDGDSTLPIQKRLFLGGDATVRSFFQDELGPVDAEGDPVGGLTAASFSFELRQRLFGDLHGALFYDVGTVSVDSLDFAGPYGHAIGVGLRYYLPVGPVRLDFAWNPGETFAADQPWALHLSFGFSF